MPIRAISAYIRKKNEKAIVRFAVKRFESFTIEPTLGYYRVARNRSIVLEFVGANICGTSAQLSQLQVTPGVEWVRIRTATRRAGRWSIRSRSFVCSSSERMINGFQTSARASAKHRSIRP